MYTDMPKTYLKLKDKQTEKEYFVGWSTISDDVNSDVMDTETFKECVELTDEQQKALDETGCSNRYYTIKELLECSDEFRNEEQLLEYCKANLQ